MKINNRISATDPPGLVPMRRQRRNGRVRLPACGAVATGLLTAGLLAGCGGGAHTSSTTSFMSRAIAYSNCMRSHGVPDFPDPDSQGHVVITSEMGAGLNPSSPAFQAAERDCGPFPTTVTAAQEHHQFSTALKAAACIRANGVPNYPDPKLINGVIALFFSPSVNPSSPASQKAAKKCGYRVPSGLIGAGPPSSAGGR
jgi:hypothetical protein